MKKLISCVMAIAASGISASGVNLTSEWKAEGSGTFLWGDAANWTTPAAPANAGTNYYLARIELSEGTQTIETTEELVLSRLILKVADTASLTFRLGADLYIKDEGSHPSSNPSEFVNSTASAGNFTFDLNGHNFLMQSWLGNSKVQTASNLVIKSTGNAGGVFEIGQLAHSVSTPSVRVEDNVTVRITGNQQHEFKNWVFSDASTVQFQSLGKRAYLATSGVGNLVIGDTSSTMQAETILVGDARVRGNFTVNKFSGATDGAASRLKIYNSSSKVFVGGNFYDAGTDWYDYGDGFIIFNGNPDVDREVTIRLSGLTTKFEVGESAAISGRIILKADLTTAGSFKVWENSRLNLSDHTVRAGSIVINKGAHITLDIGFGGRIISSQNLTLGQFNLTIEDRLEVWNSGDDLVLFQYGGSLSGTPVLLDIQLPAGFSYDALMHDAASKTIYLSNVTIPEPSTVTLFGGCGALLLAGAHYARRFRA